MLSAAQLRHNHRSRSALLASAAFALVMLAPLATAAAQTDNEIVTNETVVHMVTGKLSKDLIIGKINAAVPGFDLSSEGLVQLNSSKVDGNIVKAMFDVAESARRRNIPTSVTGMDEVLNNEIVIRMVSAKVAKDLIMRKLQMSPSQFDMTSAGMVNLNTNKVPQDVIKAMMLPPRKLEARTEEPVRPPVGRPPVADPKKTSTPTKKSPPAATAKTPPAKKTPA